MAASNPDYVRYTDLRLYDKSPDDIKEAAVATLQARIPDWVPSDTNIEMMLLEAMAIEVSEAGYMIDRLPQIIMEALLAMLGVERDYGTQPTADLLVTMDDDIGYVIPAGTEFLLALDNGDTVTFSTNADLSVIATTTTGVVTATGDVFSTVVNGYPTGIELSAIDYVPGLSTVEFNASPTGGVNPETIKGWFDRGVQKLQRLSEVLVVPQHFIDHALEYSFVHRANVIDNYEPSVGPIGSNGGHINILVYGAGANLSSPQKAQIQASAEAISAANLAVHVTDPTVGTVNVTVTVHKYDSFLSGTVTGNVTAAIQNYLNTETWDWSGTVRRNSLIAAIGQAAGVAYVATLTAPAADVVISSGLALATAGTISVTVT